MYSAARETQGFGNPTKVVFTIILWMSDDSKASEIEDSYKKILSKKQTSLLLNNATCVNKNFLSLFSLLPVVVPEFDVSPGLQDLSVLQPGELRLGLALRLAGEHGGGAERASDRLRRLDKLCRS